MSGTPWNDLVGRLAPSVLDYQTDQFVLRDDLVNLGKVHGVGAAEASIFYGARILDALAIAALDRVGLPAAPNVYSNLDTLQQFNLLPATTRYWAHALRRFGNSVRHIQRRVTGQESELTQVFVQRWLDWFFHRFRYGHCLPNLFEDGQPVHLGEPEELPFLIEQFEEGRLDLRSLLQQVRDRHAAVFLSTPTLPAVLAETLLDRGEHSEVLNVLNQGLAKFADDLRLRQLMGLYYSRTKDLDNALRYLKPLSEQYRDDEETAGITAGVYKRKWLRDSSNREALQLAYRTYRDGWKRSKGANAYLGINAATTALLLGRGEQSRGVAEQVRQLLRDRVDRLAKYHGDHNLVMNYWDHVTLAEAELLLGRVAEAARTYQQAADNHPDQRENIAVSRRQADEILKVLNLTWPPP